MKKLLFALIALFLLIGELSAQAPNWPTLIQKGTGLLPARHETDGAGNHYVLCDWDSAASLGGQNFQGNHFGNALLVKFAPDFSVQWIYPFADPAFSRLFGLHVDSAGNILVAGAFASQITLGSQTYSVPGPNGPSGFLVRMSPSSAVTWAKHVPVLYGAAITDIAPAPGYGLYITGVYQGDMQLGGQFVTSPNNNQGFIARLDMQGNCQWLKETVTTGDAYFARLRITQTGSIMAVGFYSDTTQLGSFALPDTATQFSNNLMLAKLDPSGTIAWVRTAQGEVSSDIFIQLQEDVLGNILVGSTYYSSVLNFGSMVLPAAGGGSVYLAKYSSTGVLQWAQAMTSSAEADLTDFALHSSGNIYATGLFSQDMQVGSAILTSNASFASPFVVEFDPAGAVQWAQTGSASYIGAGTSIKVKAAGQIDVLGVFNGTLSMPGSGTLTSVSVSPYDFDLFYTSTSPFLATPSLMKADFGFALFPNPASNKLSITFPEDLKADSTIHILDATGRVMHLQKMNSVGSSIQMELPSLSSGVYVLEVRSGEQLLRQRLIIK